MKTALTIAGLALALSGLAGCGGDDSGDGGISTDASTEDFCGAFQSFADDLGDFDPEADPSEAVEAMQGFADDIREVGVPENATDDEVEGLEITLEAIDGLGDDTTLEDLGTLEEQFSESEQEKADAFDDYLDEECGEIE